MSLSAVFLLPPGPRCRSVEQLGWVTEARAVRARAGPAEAEQGPEVSRAGEHLCEMLPSSSMVSVSDSLLLLLELVSSFL